MYRSVGWFFCMSRQTQRTTRKEASAALDVYKRQRLMDEDTKLFEDQKTFKVSFPHTVSIENVRTFIKKNQDSHVPFGMYM